MLRASGTKQRQRERERESAALTSQGCAVPRAGERCTFLLCAFIFERERVAKDVVQGSFYESIHQFHSFLYF